MPNSPLQTTQLIEHSKRWDDSAISRAIETAELKTSGEIVPVISRSLDRYQEVELLLILASLTICSLGLTLFHWLNHWDPSINLILSAQTLSAGLGWILGKLPAVQRLILGKERLRDLTHRTACQLFLELGLTETRDRTGVLILIAEKEHHVEIIADHGIHSRVPEDYWKNEVQLITQGIRMGRPTEALCEVIEQIGSKLAENFPKRADDSNELPNTPVHRGL